MPTKPLSLTALVAAPIVIASLVAPATAQNREHVQLMGDIRMLHEQTLQLHLALGSLSEALKTVTARIDDQTNLTRRAFADHKLLVDNLADDVRILREKLDDTNVRITSLSEEVEALRLAVPPAPLLPPRAEPTGDVADLAVGDDGAPLPGALVAPPTLTPGVAPQRLFGQAHADYMAGQWDLSIQGFESYLRTFPRSERADDAQYYIGENHFQDGRFREAAQAYDMVVTYYPTSDVLPDALFKRGRAFEELGEMDQARESWDLVLENHPETPAGVLAKQSLDRLDRAAR